MLTPALFLDRDGIINVDKTYVYRYEDIEWMPGIFEIIKWANDRHWKVIVLTNQSGVERGFYTKEDVVSLHQEMTNFLKSKSLHIDDWYFAVSLTDERRKPNPQMMLEAAKKHQIDLSKSIMIGDKVSDIVKVSGPEYLLLRGSYPLDAAPSSVKVFDSLHAIELFLKEHK